MTDKLVSGLSHLRLELHGLQVHVEEVMLSKRLQVGDAADALAQGGSLCRPEGETLARGGVNRDRGLGKQVEHIAIRLAKVLGRRHRPADAKSGSHRCPSWAANSLLRLSCQANLANSESPRCSENLSRREIIEDGARPGRNGRHRNGCAREAPS